MFQPAGGIVLLSLETREVGRVTVVRCNGRIVAGKESEALRAHIAWLLHTRRAIVLNLAEVGFVDSSGLGSLVRVLASTRQARAELKLCELQGHVRSVLEMTRLAAVFEMHETEEKAIAACYSLAAQAESPASLGRSILCLDSDVDVLAYLRELLRHAGYDVQSSCLLSDALVLTRVTNFDLVLLGPGKTGSPAALQAFQKVRGTLPVIELGSEFSTSHAGDAGTALLETIKAQFNPGTA